LIAKMAVDLEIDPDVFRGYGGNLDLARTLKEGHEQTV
jgi:hypothetical protein